MGNKRQSASLTSDSHTSGLDFWLVFPEEVFSCSAVTPRCSVTDEDATLMAQHMKTVKTHSLAQTVYNQPSPAEVPNWDISGRRRDSLSSLDCLSIKQLITNQVVRLNNDVALKKDKKLAQHYGKMHPLHEGNFHP